jgi:2-iminobutanoate/2-iminopropanoate deaminase
MRREVRTDSAPLPIGPYSQGIVYSGEGLVFTSGQIAISPGMSDIKGTDIKEQASCALDNVRAILKEAGCDIADIIKVTVYLTNMEDYTEFNEVYKSFFSSSPFPARSVVGVSNLPKGALVEIEAIADRSR